MDACEKGNRREEFGLENFLNPKKKEKKNNIRNKKENRLVQIQTSWQDFTLSSAYGDTSHLFTSSHGLIVTVI